MDLHILAATAHQLEAHSGLPPSIAENALHWAQQAAKAAHPALSRQGIDLEFEPTGSAGQPVARSVSSSQQKVGGAITKHTKHRAAEQRRRERINERLQVLRELVPHDTRSNTATFLEGVIAYIQNLQQRSAALEAELSALKSVRAGGAVHNSYEQQQHEVLVAQPAGSGSNPANSFHHPTSQQQHSQLFGSSWRQDSITGASPHSPEAAAAVAAAAATAAQWQSAAADGGAAAAAAGLAGDLNEPWRLLQQQQRAALSAQLCHTTEQRQALSSSPPLLHAAAAAGSAAPTLSAPAALMHSLAQHQHYASGTTATNGAASPAGNPAAAAGGTPTAASAAQPAVQPIELQNVLEKALLAALQHQAQQLATQLLNRGN